VWGRSQQKYSDDMEHQLCLSPVLALPYLQQPFDIETNDYDYVVHFILTQHDHLVAYHSEKLLDVILKYPTYEK
jgi:hypothetical protein